MEEGLAILGKPFNGVWLVARMVFSVGVLLVVLKKNSRHYLATAEVKRFGGGLILVLELMVKIRIVVRKHLLK